MIEKNKNQFKETYKEDFNSFIEDCYTYRAKTLKHINTYLFFSLLLAFITFLPFLGLGIYIYKNLYTCDVILFPIETIFLFLTIYIIFRALLCIISDKLSLVVNINIKFMNYICKIFNNTKKPYKISKKCIKQSQLFNNIKHLIISDNYTFQYKNNKIYISEICYKFLKNELLIKIKLNKIIKNKIIITTALKNNTQIKTKRLKQIKFDNIQQENCYEIYSIRPETENLITAELINAIREIQNIFETKNIRASIFGDNFVIYIPSGKYLFEFEKLSCNANYVYKFDKFMDKIYPILKLADFLTMKTPL